LIKIHKEDAPIRPIINWSNAPAYKLAKMVSKKLKSYIPLPYNFNVNNIVHLINDLTDTPYDPNLKLSSFDITNLYNNFPTNELLKFINIMCEKHGIGERLEEEIMKTSGILNDQNYFRVHDTIYIQNEGLAMGATTLSIFSEIYLQHIENPEICVVLL